MKAIPNHDDVCPTCGQRLTNPAMQRRVERNQAKAKRDLRAQLQADIEASVEERVQGEYAGRNARMRARLAELERQADTRSAHDLGVDHEHDILGLLRSAFPTDRIDHHGRQGDIVHTVMRNDREVGPILVECKNARAWQNAWLPKLKQDGRERGTPYLVLVTRRLPAKASGFCVRDDIAICEPAYVVAVATIMRQWVISAYRTDTGAKGVPEKARRLYDYLAGAEFRASFSEILDCANQLDALDKTERRQHELSWKKRAKLLGQLCAAHLRIDAKLEAEVEETTSPASPSVVVDIPERNEQRAA
jgi:hypothetical protein